MKVALRIDTENVTDPIISTVILEKKARLMKFESVDKFIEHLLSQSFDNNETESDIDPDEEELVMQRLRKLGYL